MIGNGLIITWNFKSRYVHQGTKRFYGVNSTENTILSNKSDSVGALVLESKLWEAEAQSAVLIDSLVTAPVHLYSYVSLAIHNCLSYLFSAAPFPSILPTLPYLWSFFFTYPSILLFTFMPNLCFFLSSLYFPQRQSLSISPWLCLSLHRSPMLSQNNSSDLSKRFFFFFLATRGQFSGPGRASAFLLYCTKTQL